MSWFDRVSAGETRLAKHVLDANRRTDLCDACDPPSGSECIECIEPSTPPRSVQYTVYARAELLVCTDSSGARYTGVLWVACQQPRRSWPVYRSSPEARRWCWALALSDQAFALSRTVGLGRAPTVAQGWLTHQHERPPATQRGDAQAGTGHVVAPLLPWFRVAVASTAPAWLRAVPCLLLCYAQRTVHPNTPKHTEGGGPCLAPPPPPP